MGTEQQVQLPDFAASEAPSIGTCGPNEQVRFQGSPCVSWGRDATRMNQVHWSAALYARCMRMAALCVLQHACLRASCVSSYSTAVLTCRCAGIADALALLHQAAHTPRRYKVVKQLGDGTYGSVWKAMNRQTNEVVRNSQMQRCKQAVVARAHQYDPCHCIKCSPNIIVTGRNAQSSLS